MFRDLELVESLGSGMTYIIKKYGRDNFQFLDNFIRIMERVSSSQKMPRDLLQ